MLKDQNQILNILLLEAAGQRFVLAGVHLKAGTAGADLRSIQIRELIRRVDALAHFSKSAILVGDFNQHDLALLGYTDVYACHIKANKNKVPCARTQAKAPGLKSANAKDSRDHNTRLDYIFFRNLNFQNARALVYEGADIDTYDNKNISDHFPIGVIFN
jgi:endonuclease/exonuclease/phosphatase family metal-dependent hydrolase